MTDRPWAIAGKADVIVGEGEAGIKEKWEKIHPPQKNLKPATLQNL